MADFLIKQGKDYRVVSADMSELVECRICGRNTRTEWQTKHGRIFACANHNKDVVWNKIIG